MPRRNRKRNRMRNFDYSSNNLYFITACVDDRRHFFGGIYRKTMCINCVGSIIWQQWEWLIQRYSYLIPHAFIVMPNHIHAVLEIDSGLVLSNDGVAHTRRRDRSRPVPTDVANTPNNITNTNIQSTKIKPLSELIGAFKTTASKQIHQIGFPQFAWQRSFHDRIIRNERAYQNIINYTIHNPQQWHRDRNNV
ncbi:MAG: hypothetical protein HYV41_04080 [Candidatus Magasanikbacteria bacterium]|nr:hypothetical protein [Candidatus Magasanikbacteria bacterium]